MAKRVISAFFLILLIPIVVAISIENRTLNNESIPKNVSLTVADSSTSQEDKMQSITVLEEVSANINILASNPIPGIDDDAVLGDKNAPVTMIMFGGYEEPFSGRFWRETFPYIKSEYIDTGKVRFVFRDFPLVELFPLDGLAAEVAECTGEYGDEAYYEMFNELFEKGVEEATDLGYDIYDCLESEQMATEVARDYIDAWDAGVRGSPAFFINGEIISGAQPLSVFQDAINNALDEVFICSLDVHCNDNNQYTEDRCINPGQSDSECTYQNIICINKFDCSDNNLNTEDICHNPETVDSYCENLPLGEENVELTINSLINNSIWNTRRIPIDLETSEVVDEITYTDMADPRARERTLCRNCNQYGRDRLRYLSLTDGEHILKFMAKENGQIFDEEIIEIFIDTRKPRIGRIEPRRGIFYGEFYFEFTEENPKELSLHYEDILRNISIGFGKECGLVDKSIYKCMVEVDLSDFDGKEINYWFELSDIADNKFSSTPNKIRVDTTPPIINNFEYKFNKRNIEFKFNVTESNLYEINYVNWIDIEPQRYVRLCSILRNGMCKARKSFSPGEYNLTILVVDRGGNYVEINIQFECDRFSCKDLYSIN